MKKTIKKLLICVMVLAMLGGNGMYAFARTLEYGGNDDIWETTKKITVTSSKTTSSIKGVTFTNTTGYYTATATCYDKNGKNVAYKGVYKTEAGAEATAKKIGKVKRGKACSWVNDEKKNICSKIWSVTINK